MTSSLAPARTVALSRWQGGLLAVPVRVRGREASFLFDTGAGLTSVDARLAGEIGLRPWGRLTGHRMSGERVDLARAEGLHVGLGPLSLDRETVGVLDFRRFLPADFPVPAGVVALDAFEEAAVVLDVSAGELRLPATPAEFDAETADWADVPVSISRPVGGLALDLFVVVTTPEGKIRLELDTGNTGPAILAPHAAAALGLREDGAVDLPIGDRSLRTPAIVRDIVHDGNLGLGFLASVALGLDVSRGIARLRR